MLVSTARETAVCIHTPPSSWVCFPHTLPASQPCRSLQSMQLSSLGHAAASWCSACISVRTALPIQPDPPQHAKPRLSSETKQGLSLAKLTKSWLVLGWESICYICPTWADCGALNTQIHHWWNHSLGSSSCLVKIQALEVNQHEQKSVSRFPSLHILLEIGSVCGQRNTQSNLDRYV